MGFLSSIIGGKTPKQPEVVQTSPVADDSAIKEKAAEAAKEQEAAQRRRQQQASLLATGSSGAGVTAPAQISSLLAYGKTALGQ